MACRTSIRRGPLGGALVFGHSLSESKWRSGFLPKAIGALMALAGACYLLNSIADPAAPAFARLLSPHLMDPTLIGEAALALWLLIFGVSGKANPR